MSDVDHDPKPRPSAPCFALLTQSIFGTCHRHFHEQRINAALLLSEPLQARWQIFYGCWYDIPYINLFTRIKVYPHVAQDFRDCIDKKRYIQRNSMLATRWSVRYRRHQ